MPTIENSPNKPKTERDTVREPTATSATFRHVHLVHAGHGIPLDLGPSVRIELLTSPKEEDYWVIKGTLDPGANVPLHSHDDAEDFYVLSGEAEALVETTNGLEWHIVQTGDFIHIPGDMKHAWRNRFSRPAEKFIVTPAKLGRFFHEMDELIRAGGNNGTMEKLRDLSKRYGYWLGSPEENAAVGISLP
jgi:quercetin dioxygenase-like cupin family protein